MYYLIITKNSEFGRFFFKKKVYILIWFYSLDYVIRVNLYVYVIKYKINLY